MRKVSVKVSKREPAQRDSGAVVQSGPVCPLAANHTPSRYRPGPGERIEPPLLPLED